MANILSLICARAGSKGVTGKNIRSFLGYPIVYYTLSAYSLYLNRYAEKRDSYLLAVNTDSEQLITQIEATSVPFCHIARKNDLAGDRVSKIDVIRDSLVEVENDRGIEFDMVLDLDITSPLRKVIDIRNVADALRSSASADIALTITEARRNPYFNQLTMDEGGYLKTVMQSEYIARQQAPVVYDANASLYAYRPHYLKEGNGIFLNAKLVGSLMEDTAVLDIDSERDFKLMESIANYLYETDTAFGEIHNHISQMINK